MDRNISEEQRSIIRLPGAPARLRDAAVAAWSEPVDIDTYAPLPPDQLPAFLDRRVYQGSSGRVFPLPFHERISSEKAPRAWQAVHLENRWVRLMILPELGGRIHIGYDKVAGYDFFYRNNVIKPALVGLTGPWISGGVEFNWPQHHRPATFLPTDVEIEQEPDGAVTVWCSDHDPFARMKGMHGIRLRPDSSLIEARVRLYNRTEQRQTFLWWANVAAAVSDHYQSFFPTDVNFVADHARRAIADFPAPRDPYYGVDYPSRRTMDRPDGDRIDWYRNIPVPTSYMVLSTGDEFFGGYDHARNAGFVHFADKAVSPGKKQWTWGNAASGRAWDANLTDDDGPYVELMAGVFTDNQPDFAFLAPGETKTFSQYWYPISDIGPVQQAAPEAALRVESTDDALRVFLHPTTRLTGAMIELRNGRGHLMGSAEIDLDPGVTVAREFLVSDVAAVVLLHDGREILRHELATSPDGEYPSTSTAPPQPEEVGTVDELYLIGAYLRQYRHATRRPEPYWEEALRRDPGDARSLVALAQNDLHAARYSSAESRLRQAVARLTGWTPTPVSGEAHYHLGLALVHQGRDHEADVVFAKAAWDAAWRSPSWFERSRIAGRRGDFIAAERLLNDLIRIDQDHSRAFALLGTIAQAAGRVSEAEQLAHHVLARDPLDQWARDLVGRPKTADATVLLDIALEYVSAGFLKDGLRLLDEAWSAAASTPLGQVQVQPLVGYHRAVVYRKLGDAVAAATAIHEGQAGDTRWAAASRSEDVAALEAALETNQQDGLAAYLLANWYFDRDRELEAIGLWETATVSDSSERLRGMAERNLGLAAYNVLHNAENARDHYGSAVALLPGDAKIRSELDQLDARRGVSVEDRLASLEDIRSLVETRDDLTIVLTNLLTTVGRHVEALRILSERDFQPWEGGEGLVLAAWEEASLACAADAADPAEALALIRAAVDTPPNLGEARHLLANSARLHLALGDAYAAISREPEAYDAWTAAAGYVGDFIGMQDRAFSLQTAYSAMALRRLGRYRDSEALVAKWSAYVDHLERTPAEIDFFATSLPTMLTFTDDQQMAQDRQVREMRETIQVLLDSGTDQPE